MEKNGSCRIQYFRYSKGMPVAILFCLAACLVLAANASAADARKSAGSEPLIITSLSLLADNTAKTATFVGNVVARKGESTLYADKMIVYSRKDADQNKDEAGKAKPAAEQDKDKGDIEKIEADGNVRLVKGTRVITSKFATYYADPDERVIFTGEPKAAEGQNVVTGTKMTYFMNDDRSLVENSKVFLVNKERQSTDAKQKKGKAR
ncbi:MAG TPA: LptA/OstA family protein [Dissulfurispiraceae bacterium]|nr:LptA/OstA family protein [Dissulfurispiraceae bacterium]